jgi:hypothetical protein
MRYVLSAHASQKLSLRGILPREVERVLVEPGQILEAPGVGQCYQSKFMASTGKMYLLRVFVNDAIDPAVVVTVYRTSQINKYWR